jgi:PDDEXK-like domain of unknown function (DUF3799)
MLVVEPGVYDIPGDIYHSDPCETPSLSAGMINDLLAAPAKCFENSRRLNPDWEPPEKQEKFSIGSVSHIMLLEPHMFDQQVVVVRGRTKDGKPSAGYASQDAKDQRDDAFAAGKTPILPEQLEQIRKARAAFLAHPFTRASFGNGKHEQSMFWRHPIYGFWCRSRPDFMADSLAHLCDYKATANADPTRFGKHAYDMGYHRRAAFYLEGFEVLFGHRADHYWFCSQETKAPYLTSVCELDMQALEAGQEENDYAAGIFDRCLKTGEWHGYRDRDHLDTDRAFRVGLPTYAYMQIDERLGRTTGSFPKRRVEETEGV